MRMAPALALVSAWMHLNMLTLPSACATLPAHRGRNVPRLEGGAEQGGECCRQGQRVGLAPGEVYSVTMTMLAEYQCNDVVHQSTNIDYHFTGAGGDESYKTVLGERVYLPLVLRAFP
jgi:hypothetical protein